MKSHYGEGYVSRCAHEKKNGNGNSKTRRERQKVTAKIKRGRRTARRKAREEIRDYASCYQEGDACPDCKGTLELVYGDEPYSVDHLQCNKCDGTFN
jgi:hypothetical protein